MKYLKTHKIFENIQKGKDAYLLMTSDKKFFVKDYTINHELSYTDRSVSGFVLRPVDELDQTDLTSDESSNSGHDILTKIIKYLLDEDMINFVVKDVTYFADVMDELSYSPSGNEVIINREYLEEMVEDVLNDMDHVYKLNNDVYDIIKNKPITINDWNYNKIVNDLIIVKFFTGFSEMDKTEYHDI